MQIITNKVTYKFTEEERRAFEMVADMLEQLYMNDDSEKDISEYLKKEGYRNFNFDNFMDYFTDIKDFVLQK